MKLIPTVRQGLPALLNPEFDAEFCSGAFSDELDQMGKRHQVAAGWTMNRPDLRCFGRARTVALETTETEDERITVGLSFLADVRPGEFLVVEGSHQFAYFGELMTRLALRGGLSGIAIEGLTRDSFFTQTVDLPILSRGYSPVDIKGRGRVRDVDVPVTVGEVACHPGDYVFADSDALVVVPEDDVHVALARVNRVAAHEAELKRHIGDGMTVAEILSLTSGF